MTDYYAVVGNPIGHSLSPWIHTEFAKQTGEDLVYTGLEPSLNAFKEIVDGFRIRGGKGVNVTLPFKLEAFQIANKHSVAAKKAGAANTLVFYEDGSIFADTTDGVGLIKDLQHHQYSLLGKSILILGAGGAVRSILVSLLSQNLQQCVIANRTAEKAIQLAKDFQTYGAIQGVGLDDLQQQSFDLIINATSAGLTADLTALPRQLISRNTWCYDLMYGPKKSSFLQWGLEHHAAACLDGLGMLVEQAAAAFYLWRGVHPETREILKILRSRIY
jgi:shikimate dehydrogenase